MTRLAGDVSDWVGTYGPMVASAMGLPDPEPVKNILAECATWDGLDGPGRVNGTHRAAEAVRRLNELLDLDTAGLLARLGYDRLAEPDD